MPIFSGLFTKKTDPKVEILPPTNQFSGTFEVEKDNKKLNFDGQIANLKKPLVQAPISNVATEQDQILDKPKGYDPLSFAYKAVKTIQNSLETQREESFQKNIVEPYRQRITKSGLSPTQIEEKTKKYEEQMKTSENIALGTTGDGVESIFKNISSKLLKEGTEEGAKKLLQQDLKLSDDVAKEFAPKFAKATEPKVIDLLLGEVDEVVKAGKQVAPKAEPLMEEARKYKSSEDLDYFNPMQYVEEQVKKQNLARSAGEKSLYGKTKDFLKNVKNKLVDFNAPIEDVLSEAQKEGRYTILPKADITNQIDRALRAPTIGTQFIKDNGLDVVIKEVDNLDNLEQYLIAKQARAVAGRNIETGRDLAKDELLINAFAPKYEAYAKQVTEYSRKLLDYAVDAGLVSEDLAKELKIRYPEYVPINRIFSDAEKTIVNVSTKGKASLSKQSAVQKLVGSEREIENPIESLLTKTNDVFKQGEINKTAKLLASYEKLPGNPFQLRQLATDEKVGLKSTISVFRNGIKEIYETTPEIANAAKALNVQQINILGQILALPVRIAKVGITGINLPFVLSNITKDQLTAIINSKDALKTSIANPKIFLSSLFEAVGHGKVYQEMAREGALGTSFDLARGEAKNTVQQIRSGRSLGSRIKYTVTHPKELLRAVEDIVGRSEEFTRIQQYAGTKQARLAEGVSEEEAKILASRASRENTVNFARRGEWGAVLNSAFLYLNAGIQGSRTFLRNAKTKPKETATKIGLFVFAPIAGATAWNLSDPKRAEVYNDISEFEKKGNIILIPPNPTKNKDGTWNVIKIPLSQEVNDLASIPRKGIEQAYGKDPVSVKDITSALAGTLSPVETDPGSLLSTLTPQAIKPTLEGYANMNFFTGNPQVPRSMEKLSPELQAKDYTSGTARIIGKTINQSPIKVEEWIKSTIGGIGSQYLNASDNILAGLDIIPKDQIGGQNTIKAILARFSKARGGEIDKESNDRLEELITKQADENFRLKQEAEILYADLKKLPRDEANRIANQIGEKNPRLFEKLEDVANAEKLNLNYNDRLILQLQVSNGERAKFIWENLKALKTREEKNAYVQELQDKKIISDTVFDQIIELKEKNY